MDGLNKNLLLEIPKLILIEDLGLMNATESSKKKARYGLYKCGYCGNEFRTDTYKVNADLIKSCGCYRIKKVKERFKKHGLRNTRLYNIWANIKARVLNPKHKKYSE